MKAEIEWNGKRYEVDTEQRVFIMEDNGVKTAMLYMPGLPCPVQINVVCHREDKGSGTCWIWNGDVFNPTFSPSILTQLLWGEKRKKIRNHVFVRNGKIQYLSDCSHKYAGKAMVELPKLCDWPEDMKLWE